MKRKLIFLFTIGIIFSCLKKDIVNIESVLQKYKKAIQNIDNIEYTVEILTSFSDGNSRILKGFTVINKNSKDTLFGFSFFANRNDLSFSTIYRNGIAFHIMKKENKYEQEVASKHSLGSPAGQLIYKDFFKIDSVYKEVKFNETASGFHITYYFANDSVNKVTQRIKEIEINKETFLPTNIKVSLQPNFGKKQTKTYTFKNIKINNSVSKSVSDFIQELNSLKLIDANKPKFSNILNKKLPTISLPNLLNDEIVKIKINKITLIDFWEVWCGPCIASFEKLENLKTKFKNDLNIIGIVSEDKKNAIKLVQKKNITFLNLIGNKNLKNIFSIESWPRYFLVDTNGIIVKEYHSFSKEIEIAIKEIQLKNRKNEL